MASNIRRRSGSQLSPEEENLLQTVLSQDSAALASLRLHHGTASAAVLQMDDGYPETFVLHVASLLEREGKPVNSSILYDEVERQAALRSESFMRKLNAQTFSKTLSEVTEMKTAASSPSSELRSSATSFRSASHLPTSDITEPGSAEAGGGAATTTTRHTESGSAAQPWYSPQFVLTESNRAREAPKSGPVSTDCTRGVQSPTTEKGKGGIAQQENSRRNSALFAEDVVDGATLGHPYEDVVDNVEAKPGLTTSRPQHKPGVSLFSNAGTYPVVKPGQSGESPDDCKKSLRIRECLQAVTGENKILESYRLCTVCRKSPRNITFLPCGHFTTCRDCAGPIYVCGLCGKNVLATVDTFLS